MFAHPQTYLFSSALDIEETRSRNPKVAISQPFHIQSHVHGQSLKNSYWQKLAYHE